VVDPPPPAEHAGDGSEVGEEESDHEGNRSPVEEITEESITESSSEDDEPLARLRQRALPNNRGGRRRGRNRGQGRGRPIGLRRIRRGRRYSIEGPAVPEQEQQDLPVGDKGKVSEKEVELGLVDVVCAEEEVAVADDLVRVLLTTINLKTMVNLKTLRETLSGLM